MTITQVYRGLEKNLSYNTYQKILFIHKGKLA